MRKYRKYLLSAGITAVGLAMFVGGYKIKADSKADDVIADGVYIGNVEVSNMTLDEAKSAVDSYVNSMNNVTFTLKGAKGSIKATADDMALTADVDAAVEDAMAVTHTGNLIVRYKQSVDLKSEPIKVGMHYEVDKEKTANIINASKDELNIAAKDSTLTRENGEFQYVPGTHGTEVNIIDSVYGINDYLSNEWDGTNNEITLVTEEIDPKGTEDQLANIKDLLGEFSTDYSSSAAGRAQNVANACAKINGTILYPGDEFSVYEAISPFTEENGYGIAGAYENGQVVESVGGGVCQVATTLYNAIIRAELEITMRYNHSMIVNYVKPSSDAAIAGTYKDLRFKNTLDAPVYIEGITEGGIITFKVFGVETRPSNREISFESETISTTPPKVEFQYDYNSSLGNFSKVTSTHQGLVAKLWKVVKVDGEVQSREEFNNSSYNSSPTIITVGVAGASSSQISSIKAAAASGDESRVRAAVSAAKAANEQKVKDAQEKAKEQAKKEEKAKKKEEAKEEKKDNKKKEKTDKTDKANKDKTSSNKDDSSSEKDNSKGDSSDNNSDKED